MSRILPFRSGDSGDETEPKTGSPGPRLIQRGLHQTDGHRALANLKAAQFELEKGIALLRVENKDSPALSVFVGVHDTIVRALPKISQD